MKEYILVNMGNGTAALCLQVATFDGEELAKLNQSINRLLVPTATDTRVVHTDESDSSTALPDPADSPQEDE